MFYFKQSREGSPDITGHVTSRKSIPKNSVPLSDKEVESQFGKSALDELKIFREEQSAEDEALHKKTVKD